MTPDAQQPEYIITEDELESLYAMTHIKYEQQVTEIHQHVHTRPHTPAPDSLEDKIRYYLAINVPELSITRNEMLVGRIMEYVVESESPRIPVPASEVCQGCAQTVARAATLALQPFVTYTKAAALKHGEMVDLMRRNGLKLDDLNDPMQKLAFTFFSEIGELSHKAEVIVAEYEESLRQQAGEQP